MIRFTGGFMNARNSLLVALAALAMGANCRNVDLPEEVTFLKGGAAASGAGIQVNLSGGTTTTESGVTATFAVSLNTKPTANVTITLTSDNTAEGQLRRTSGTCDSAGSVAVGSCTLTFTDANWLNPQNVTVVGQNDDYADGNIAYKINLTATSADSDYNGKTATANLTNNDNDTAGFVATPASGLATKDDGSTATSKIKLLSKPTANVIFSVKSDNTGAGDVTTPASKSFTFTDANWSTSQNLIVTGASTIADYKIVIDGSVASSDPNYNGITGTVFHTGIGVKNVTAGSKFIFFTSSAYSGNLGGISGADAKCNADSNKPNGSTYKAIIALSGAGGRVACTTGNCSGGPGEHTDWVLYPTTQYTRTDGTTVIGTTTANGIFTFALSNSVGGGSSPWTGLSTTWTNLYACPSWTGTSGSATAGSTGSKTDTMLDGGYGGGFGLSCSSNYPIYCAEQ
ncbi:MAG: DUF1554 domain-containing protein [Spirochaetes bacterium]|nr:DUF1554 domain-containing protein [Spirochaetota bacterium]